MNEAENTDHLFDFSNMPLTPEQKILAVLERIEVLLTPAPVVDTTPPKLPFSKARGK